MKACVYEAIVHSAGAYLLFSFLLQLLVQDQPLRRNIANVPRSLDETDHVTNNTIYLCSSILPEDIANIFRNSCSSNSLTTLVSCWIMSPMSKQLPLSDFCFYWLVLHIVFQYYFSRWNQNPFLPLSPNSYQTYHYRHWFLFIWVWWSILSAFHFSLSFSGCVGLLSIINKAPPIYYTARSWYVLLQFRRKERFCFSLINFCFILFGVPFYF